ncbi:MAG: sulfotransferase [Burkholderiaceae bacterium]
MPDSAFPASAQSPQRPHAAARDALARQDPDAARQLLSTSLADRPDDAEALCLLALALWRGPVDMEGAAANLRCALALRPSDPRILTLCASLALHLGELDEALNHAEQALSADPAHAPAYVVLARARPGRVADAQLDRMRFMTRQPGLSKRKLRPLHNAVGRVLDARGEFDAAFAHFSASNACVEQRYEPALREARLAQARRTFTPEFFARHSGMGVRDAGCVFVVGMPRSGSTLLEQVLAAHPRTATCHESDALSQVETAWLSGADGKAASPFAHYTGIDAAKVARSARDYLAATSRQMRGEKPFRRVDKRLGNFLFMPLIRLLFPDASVLHTQRHPLDVCLSCFTQGFDGHWYANDLTHLAHFYGNYHGYMQLWSTVFPDVLRHCRYEDMVADLEAQARRIVSAVGLEWHDACAQPHSASRFVSTASAAQVREPVHGARVERWRHYEKHLQPLIAGLGGHAGIERLQREFA